MGMQQLPSRGGFIRAAFYAKNLPTWERAGRVMVGAVLGLAPLFVLMPVWGVAATLTTAAMTAVTGFVGFCPACYFAGRRLQRAPG